MNRNAPFTFTHLQQPSITILPYSPAINSQFITILIFHEVTSKKSAHCLLFSLPIVSKIEVMCFLQGKKKKKRF